MDIRMYDDLEAQLEETVWALGEEAALTLPLDSNLAEEKAQKAWDLIPEPKHTWGITSVTLHQYVQILNYNSHMQRSVELLNEEIIDLESAGYRIIHAGPYIQMAETLLLQSKPVLAHEYLKKAYSIGRARAFRDQPKLYLEMAKSKVLDEQAILLRFKALDVNAKLLSELKDSQ
ncbi:hypothetical protein C0638_00130 [Paenibacillus sp. lzh-N1]|uniref:hypothetical protein n=1 Tax=Paenibacillus sp. lzh-N1 TaxID=2069255 RepID=UPI000C80E398|nr:hypothetical protein [Paenibacillus sp. lzh-N1]AUO05079.1 hypothetical protein C0638_00130 [Paenibacillus sp. lzh-N1]